MGTSAKHTVEIGYATAKDIQRYFRRWARAVGVENNPLGRIGPTLADAWTRDQLSSTLVPDLPDVLSEMIGTHGPEATICSRSIVLSARMDDRVIGGLVARPQRRFIDGVQPYGMRVQVQTLVRLMKLEIVTVEPEYQRQRVAATMVKYALDVMEKAHVHLVYGSYPADRQLGPFYRSLGFTVLGFR
ncbi:GNAT family N-acetyltransferase [Nocardia gipuzkoensis]|uniref:GNAT family N-acetyltransferase n=1 Tax=Nocardia gipuzkoensis TaxID=2749991 RepID=UPI00237DA6E7|nr:GNAT family N-acetyltransferase [Nocardia gipuzkoensis]MDE1674362.1 GNAT family N-acetyltransferase [Nocardia gipuzkoensis]